MTNRRQVLLNNRPVLRETTSAVRRRPETLSLLLAALVPFINGQILARALREELPHDRIIFQDVVKQRGVYTAGAFIVFDIVFVTVARVSRIATGKSTGLSSAMTRTCTVFLSKTATRSRRREASFIRRRTNITRVNSPGRGSLCPPTRVIAPSGEDTRDCNSP